MNIQPISDDDVFEWPEGTWCFRHAAGEYWYMSDDYRVIPVGSPEWDDVTQERG